MKKVIMSLAIILVSIALAGCSGNNDKQSKESESKTETVSSKEKESTKKEESSKDKESTNKEEASDGNKTAQENSTSTATNNENPAKEDWKVKFEEDLYNKYQVTVKSYVDYGDGRYGVFVNEIDTGENAYVTVDSATGQFHG